MTILSISILTITEGVVMRMTAKFDGRCKRCGGALPVGSQIEWSRETGATHVEAATCEQVRAQAVTVPAVSADGAPIARFLLAAQERGLKFPKARFLAPGGGEMRLSVAGDQSRFPGSIQVVVRDQWIGRIEPTGKVSGGSLAENAQVLDALSTIAADPAAAAKAYGALMGRCSFCDLTITDEGSIEVGYGPVCAKKFGLPHKPKGTRVLAA